MILSGLWRGLRDGLPFVPFLGSSFRTAPLPHRQSVKIICKRVPFGTILLVIFRFDFLVSLVANRRNSKRFCALL